MKILIVASSKFPVPAVKGGAVPNLIEEIIKEHENKSDIELYCCTLYDYLAEKESVKYSNTSFIWAKVPKRILFIDKCIYTLFGKILKMNRLQSLSYFFQVVWFTFFVGKVLKKNEFDRVIFENSVPMMFALKLFRNKKKYLNKYFLHMHSVPRRYYGNANIIKNCRRLICVSRYVANEILKDKRLKIDPKKICIMYNCIDTKLFHEMRCCNEIKEKYNLSNSNKIILFAGRLCKDKGIVELIKAFKQIKFDNIHLIVVGANFYKSGIVSSFEKDLYNLYNDISEKITFTGYIDYNNIPKYYSIADIIVLPSIWDEPAGMTILEAMACKKPVITTRSGGIPEYTGEDTCILLERDGELINNIVYNIEKILNNISEQKLRAEKCEERALQFNEKYYYSQFIDILKN